MARDLEHLQLPVWQRPLSRRRRVGGRQPVRDRRAHGQQLLSETENMANRLQQRRQDAPAGINPKFIFKLQLNRQGVLDDDHLTQMGLRMLAKDASRAIVVFPNDETLRQLRRRIEEYSGRVETGHRYNELASIDAIVDLTAEDRTGQRLTARPLDDDEIAPLDVELWHSGERDECRARIREVEEYLGSLGLRVTDSWVGDSLCLLRARLNSEALAQLLATDYVKEIDRRPEPSFEMLDVVRLDLGQLDFDVRAREDLVGVLVVDSGVMQRHPLLGPVIGDAQVFPDALRERIRGGAEDGDWITGGHGTAVSGIAAYNDIGQCIEERRFEPSALLFSARVTDNENQFDEDELAEHQLEEAIEYFLANYAAVRVINISLGDEKLVCDDGRYQFRLAAVIDELAYRHRDREILFVISAGNYRPDLEDEEILRQYPNYLLDPAARVINPATAALAVTVGGISYGAGRAQSRYERDTDRSVAGERGWPSPFTRTGWGLGGSVKPDFVDFAGDLRFERGRIPNVPAQAGVPSTAKDFAPPNGRLFRTVAGTSFAAPRIANLAAQLFREFPEASSNLIRALIASSARLPDSRPEEFAGGDPWDDEILRVYGYGQPAFERARWSGQNSALLIADSTIELDTFQLYTIPSLPQEFLTTRGDRHLSICLAFDPPTRHTRADYYFGVGVEFKVFRNATHEAIAEAIRAYTAEEREAEGGVIPLLKNIRGEGEPPIRVDLMPSVNVRKKSTLQRGIRRIGPGWKYDRGEMILAVICQRRWAPEDITSQRFAVVAAVEHSDPSVEVYQHIRQQTRVYQRVRVQV